MNDIKDIPYSTAEFDQDGKLLHEPQVPTGTTDLIVASHGWNNTRVDAESLYSKLFGNLADQIRDDPAYQERKVAIVGVIWPSHKFDELMSGPPGKAAQAGGAASTGSGEDAGAAQAAMHAAIKRVEPLFPGAAQRKQLDGLHDLVPKLENDPAAQVEFVQTLRNLLDPQGRYADQRHPEDASDVFFEGNPSNIFDNVKMAAPASATERTVSPTVPEPGTNPGDVVGKAAGFFDVFSGAANAVTSLLNHTTYFEMKKRAGTVGKNGVGPLIDRLDKQVGRIHLVGHSFGGRVVSATAANSTTSKLHTLALLQAAFSHFGFSRQRGGFFRSVIDAHRVSGPILITHTKNDRAVGLAYPAASRINGDKASAFGDANDDFGGIGSNGAQKMETDEIFTGVGKLVAVGQSYDFQPGKLHNLESSAYIVAPDGGDAHGFVFVPEVAWAISRAMLT